MTAPVVLSTDERLALFPAMDSMVYLNTGSAGPLLAPVAQVMTDSLRHELHHGRADNASWVAFLDSRTALRDLLGSLVGADGSEIVLTHHTTEGLNLVLWGIDWKPGDRIAITSLEHDAGIAAVQALAKRHALIVDVIEVGFGSTAEVLAALPAALARKPRLLLASHVAYATGAVLPIAGIVEAAHAAGTAVLVDGAQAVGAIEVDVRALGADFYSFNGYKWLCGPEGSGGLVVRQGWHERLLPSHGGAFGIVGSTLRIDDLHHAEPAPGAARYESGSWFRPQLVGLAAAVDWYRGLVAGGGGAPTVAAMAELCATRLADELGAVIHTPVNETRSGLVAFTLPGRVASEVSAALEGESIIIRSTPIGHLRVSCAAFTTPDDIAALLAALALPTGSR